MTMIERRRRGGGGGNEMSELSTKQCIHHDSIILKSFLSNWDLSGLVGSEAYPQAVIVQIGST